MLDQAVSKQTIIAEATDKLHASIDSAENAFESLKSRLSHALFMIGPEPAEKEANSAQQPMVEAISPIHSAASRVAKLENEIQSVIARLGI